MKDEEDGIIKKSGSLMSPMDRKNFLMKKLRIFGETFIEQNPRDKNKETQTMLSEEPLLGIVGNSKFSNYGVEKEEKITMKSQYRNKRNRNKSLIIKLDNSQKLGMADM